MSEAENNKSPKIFGYPLKKIANILCGLVILISLVEFILKKEQRSFFEILLYSLILYSFNSKVSQWSTAKKSIYFIILALVTIIIILGPSL